ncbi:peptide chain release factor-like protein [Clostridium sp.]|uniref:peptide chain release factor family protein n=1 Tax=Clostridium sp. TaxID=1506 RepID=UPI002626E6C7|nr:peptide chain release factor-like protein [Clostridium sp.]
MDNDYKDFEQYGLTSEDFKINTYKRCIMDDYYKRGVSIELHDLNIIVSCHSEKSQVQNKKKCLEFLKLIIEYEIGGK